MKAKSLLIALIMLVVFGCATQTFASLSVGDANYVGRIHDAQPSDPSDEVGYIADLITLAPGQGVTNVGGSDYDRIFSALAGPFDAPVVTDAVRDNSGNTTINLTGTYQYILGKYDGPNWGDEVWYFPDGITGSVVLPSKQGGFGLSHISAYNPVEQVIPEPATLLIWLGLGIATAAMVVRPKG